MLLTGYVRGEMPITRLVKKNHKWESVTSSIESFIADRMFGFTRELKKDGDSAGGPQMLVFILRRRLVNDRSRCCCTAETFFALYDLNEYRLNKLR